MFKKIKKTYSNVITLTIQFVLIPSIQKSSSTSFPKLLNNSLSALIVKGRFKLRICKNCEILFLKIIKKI